ncbi:MULTISPECIES: hypothetical protein [Acidithiobacillus]|nr:MULTISPECIES: hypothetical protein [Acidithiobacillus]MDA8175563.1 hypothetical protein [Acidithiobacillus sp.]
MTVDPENDRWSCRLFAPLFLACCSTAHPAVRRELALRAQTALLTGAGFCQEQQRLETKVAAKPAGPTVIFRDNVIDMYYHLRLNVRQGL